ncbi:TPA: DUF551 domain-containing protein [Klebsiella pneumoniae]|nr:DUF551 domain-containing protein [Klebsiella pneumoniae]EMC1560092.1 DUF551 domain-containing protein [Klebsiella pneumoniae]MBD7315686.1 DUF551 domain-containing protein [Klebsiella pneumoniae]MBD7890260.1 DUF551 domain-containing protein [Klebsiella pneumoniae]MBG2174127.1 DUF551 domain-containing protein [Klebsiella pneumoniae]
MERELLTEIRIREIAYSPYDPNNCSSKEASLIAKEILSLRDSLRWFSIDEAMPKDESTVIVRNAGGVPWIADVDHGQFYPDEFPVDRMSPGEVTHWMRFPE